MTTLAQDQLGKALLKSLIKVLEVKGTISIEDIAGIFEEIALTSGVGDPRIDRFVRSEVTKLAQYISEAKKEIFDIVPQEDGTEFFGAAGQELNAVVKATEEATNTILDSADAITAAAGALPSDATKATIMDSVTTIFDACNFQDITGQRITKVIKTLEYVEAKIARLAKLFGSDSAEVVELARKDAAEILADKRMDAALMGGPQLPGAGVSQNDIDALFGS
jgi:chemotaxis protein CheZ